MSKQAAIGIGLLALAGGAWALSRPTAPGADPLAPLEIAPAPEPGALAPEPEPRVISWLDWLSPEPDAPTPSPEAFEPSIDGSILDRWDSIAMRNRDEANNLRAFLALIRQGESRGDYRALVYGGQFESFVDHPAVIGPWKGVRRPDGRLTTAAGAYQIVRTTWLNLGGRGKYGSFSPSAQDRAAIDLIKGRRAYGAVVSGDVAEAHRLLKDEWEMFQQPRWGVAQSAAFFESQGGVA